MLDNTAKLDKILPDHLLTDNKININFLGELSETLLFSNILKIKP